MLISRCTSWRRGAALLSAASYTTRQYDKPLPFRKPLFRALAQVLLIRICINELNEPPVPPKHSVLLFKLQNLLWPARDPSVGEVMTET